MRKIICVICALNISLPSALFANDPVAEEQNRLSQTQTRVTATPAPNSAETAANSASSGIINNATSGTKLYGNANSTNVAQQAGQTSSNQNKGSIVSTIIGAGLTIKGAMMASCCGAQPACGTCVPGIIMIGMGALAFSQAGNHAGTSGAASNTSHLADGSGTSNGVNLDTNTGTTDKINGVPISKAKEIQNALASSGGYNGLKIKDGKITTPQGTYSLSDFNNPEAMSKAGFSGGQVGSAMALAGSLEKDAIEKYDKMTGNSKSKNNTGSDGGAGSQAFATGDPTSDANVLGAYGKYGKNGLNNGLNRDPSSVAGMVKNYNGEPIGVAADSIFLMMNRRYKVKESQDSFMN